eukprot:9729643-Alexandrium_andersonii.AAC.1
MRNAAGISGAQTEFPTPCMQHRLKRRRPNAELEARGAPTKSIGFESNQASPFRQRPHRARI